MGPIVGLLSGPGESLRPPVRALDHTGVKVSLHRGRDVELSEMQGSDRRRNLRFAADSRRLHRPTAMSGTPLSLLRNVTESHAFSTLVDWSSTWSPLYAALEQESKDRVRLQVILYTRDLISE